MDIWKAIGRILGINGEKYSQWDIMQFSIVLQNPALVDNIAEVALKKALYT